MCVIHSLLYKLERDRCCVRATDGTDRPTHRSFFMLFSPGAALASAQLMHAHQRRRADGGGGDGGAMGALLQDFADVSEAVSWSLIWLFCTAVLSVTFGVLSLVMIWFGPPIHLRTWRLAFVGCTLVAIASIVALVEPRVSHWLPSAQGICRTLTMGPSEVKARLRRWWRWRNKYALQQQTKLNV